MHVYEVTPGIYKIFSYTRGMGGEIHPLRPKYQNENWNFVQNTQCLSLTLMLVPHSNLSPTL